MTVKSDSEWHLDKRVPITLILTLLFQFGVTIWFVRGLSAEVKSNSQNIVKVERAVEGVRKKNGNTGERISGLEAAVVANGKVLNRIENYLLNTKPRRQ